LKESVKTFFDPSTDKAERDQLEHLISDEDINSEIRQLKHQEKSWAYMVKQDAERLQLVNELQIKRAEVVTA